MDGDGSDIELLRRWQGGCATAGNDFVERHFEVVHGYFRKRVRCEATLEDLVQQTFLASIEAHERYRGEASFRTFLIAVARHILLRHYERQRRAGSEEDPTALSDHGTTPTGALSRRENARLLEQALAQVPEESLLILRLAFWEGMNVVEIAAKLELPLNTVYSRLRRAKVALRALLSGASAVAGEERSSTSAAFSPVEPALRAAQKTG